jgi:hypothetical protein
MRTICPVGRCLPAVVLVSWILLPGPAESVPSGEDERAVFAVLLPALSRNDSASRNVVESTPLPRPRPSHADWQWFGPSAARIRGVVESGAPGVPAPFTPESFPPSVLLVPAEQLNELFRRPPTPAGPEELWGAFRDRFKVQSLYRFSRPVIGDDGFDAFVAYSYGCGSLCGESGFVWLNRADRSDPWVVAKQLPKAIA